MQEVLPYLISVIFMVLAVFIKALSRSDELRIKASDWNLGAPAAAAGLLLVVNFLLHKPLATLDDEYKWRLGIFAFVAMASLILSLMVARASDQEEKNPSGIPKSMRGFAMGGPYLSVLLAIVCIVFAVSFH